MSNKGRYLKKKEAAPVGKKKVLLIVLAVLLVVVIGAGIIGFNYVNSMLDLIVRPTEGYNELTQEEIDAILNYNPDAPDDATFPAVDYTTPPTTAPTEPVDTTPEFIPSNKDIINILVVGQAYREGEESKLSDSMILCSINKETKTLTMTSFARDLYIQLANFTMESGSVKYCGEQRINVAYNLGWKWGGDLGAMRMLSDTIKLNFGVEVDHGVEVDFYAFQDIIDMLGGIDIELTEKEADHMTNELHGVGTFTPGVNHLTGAQALHYSRIRKIDSDFARGNRQRIVISTLIDMVRDLSMGELIELAETVLPMITTNMTNDDITTYIWELLPLLPDLQIVSNQCPAEGQYWSETVDIGGYPSAVIRPNLWTNKKILQEIAEGIEYEKK